VTESDHLNNLDPTDLKILLELIRDPRIQIGELSDSLGVARNTAQSRVRRLLRAGVLGPGAARWTWRLWATTWWHS
jgi:DNA-binding Lrp family transcriptional regulator